MLLSGAAVVSAQEPEPPEQAAAGTASGSPEASPQESAEKPAEKPKPAKKSKVRLTPRDDRPGAVILVNTGEWLRGRLEYMNYSHLHFNSRKWDKLDIDWEDVYYYDTNEVYEYIFRNDL